MIAGSVFEDRRQVFVWVHLVSGISLAVFICVHLLEDCCYTLSSIEAVLAMIMLASCRRIRRGADLASIENMLMAAAVVLFSALIFFQSIENTGAFWVAGFPFVAYFVHRVKKARFWVALLVSEIVVAALLQVFALVKTPYSVPQLLCLVAIVLFFWAFAHIYQSQLEIRKALLDDSYRRLESQQNRMQVVLDHSPIGIWMVDTRRHIQFLNRAWVAWSGIEEKKAQQTEDYSTLMSDELAAKSLLSDRACLDGDDAYYFREVLQCADGRQRAFDMIKVKLTDPDGAPAGLVGFAIDITGRLAAEEKNKSLEQQFHHAQRLEAMGVMAGGIAHDFNNLLTTIQGNIDLAVLEENLSEPVKVSLTSINTAAQEATELCRQMLAYSGRGLLKTETFYIRDLVEEMRSLLDVSIGKHISLQFHYDQKPTAIDADRSQASQVLLNLVINASEAIGSDMHGEIHVSVKRRHLDQSEPERFFGAELKPGCYAVLGIEDNGVGMDAKTLEHMFDPFFTTKFTGRGLGLSAILGILGSHGAGLEVDSRPGSGTRMSVWFPCSAGSVEKAEVEEKLEDSARFSGRVLLVDDEPGVLQVADRMLERLGITTATAGDGLEAIRIFADDQTFDWVLLDVTMPGMDGMECLAGLREIRPDIYVVMTSGYNADSALIPSGETAPDSFLAKPFTFSALRDAAEKASQARSG
jgi:PAS domain S-box-containing protein